MNLNFIKTFKAKKIWLPIRIRIVMLLSVALTTSLLCYVYIGTSLLIRDKTSYIYEQNESKIQTASTAIETQFSTLISFGKMLASKSVRNDPDEVSSIKENFLEHLESAGASGFLILEPLDQNHFITIATMGKEAGALEEAQRHLNWTPSAYQQEQTLIDTSMRGKLVVGTA